ncbi:hypothetical protein OAQ61_00325 [Candidatus Marinimicrobia bacterium]|nr:hypothetical protein [Candidatus Neomarinimicrobiota bacterium]
MGKSKILFINHFAGVPRLNERSLRHFILSKNLRSKDYDPFIITSQNHYHVIRSKKYPYNKVVIIDGVNFIFVRELSFKKNNLFTKFLKMISFSTSLFFAFFLRKIKLDKVKIVYSSSPDLFTSYVSYYIARKNKAKHYFEIRDIWPLSQQILHNFNKNNILIKILSKIEFFLYKNSDFLISPLKNFPAYMKENKISTPFKFIPQTYFNYNDNLTFSHDLKLDDFDKVGIYAGTVGKFYCIENILKSFPVELKEKIAIIIIGDGDAFESIKFLANEHNLNNFFILDSVDHSALLSYYTAADFAISSHPDFNELYQYGLCPLKTYDYMYHKLPILFIGNKNFLDIESSGLFETNFNDNIALRNAFFSLDKLSRGELKREGIANYKSVTKNNSPEMLVQNFKEII